MDLLGTKILRSQNGQNSPKKKISWTRSQAYDPGIWLIQGQKRWNPTRQENLDHSVVVRNHRITVFQLKAHIGRAQMWLEIIPFQCDLKSACSELHMPWIYMSRIPLWKNPKWQLKPQNCTFLLKSHMPEKPLHFQHRQLVKFSSSNTPYYRNFWYLTNNGD